MRKGDLVKLVTQTKARYLSAAGYTVCVYRELNTTERKYASCGRCLHLEMMVSLA